MKNLAFAFGLALLSCISFGCDDSNVESHSIICSGATDKEKVNSCAEQWQKKILDCAASEKYTLSSSDKEDIEDKISEFKSDPYPGCNKEMAAFIECTVNYKCPKLINHTLYMLGQLDSFNPGECNAVVNAYDKCVADFVGKKQNP